MYNALAIFKDKGRLNLITIKQKSRKLFHEFTTSRANLIYSKITKHADFGFALNIGWNYR